MKLICVTCKIKKTDKVQKSSVLTQDACWHYENFSFENIQTVDAVVNRQNDKYRAKSFFYPGCKEP